MTPAGSPPRQEVVEHRMVILTGLLGATSRSGGRDHRVADRVRRER